MSTKEKLLQAALKLFAKQGIGKTSTAQITKAVGVSEGALFVHFKKKQDLIDTLYLSIKKEAFSGLCENVGTCDSVEKNIKHLAKTMIEYFVTHYDEFVFMELNENDPQVSKKTVAEGRKVYKKITDYVEGVQKEGYLKNMDKTTLQGVFWNLIIVFVKTCKAEKAKTVKPAYLDVIWDAVKAS